MNNFLTWENLTTYTTFIAIVYMIVEFTKELKGIQKIPTKQWSFLVSFVLLVLVHIANRTFHIIDLILYYPFVKLQIKQNSIEAESEGVVLE